MNYTCTVDINLPIKETIELWNNENNFKEWQDGFKSIEHISGKPDSKGAKSKIILQEGKRKMELLETIISVELPKEKIALYEHNHMTNTQTSRFIAIKKNKTQYISEVEYIKFNGFIPNLMAKFFPRVFKKQSQKWMNQFKEFTEKANS